LEKGLFQKQLAKLIGVDEMTIINWEKDRTKPKGRYIEKLTDLFTAGRELLSGLME